MSQNLKHMRTDQVGSLLRPRYLIEAFLAYANDAIDHDRLTALQDKAIAEVVAKQQAVGLPVITDGEYRRLNWQVSFSQIDGWDLWQGAWQHFVDNPQAVMSGETPGTRGADAVEVFKVPATAKLGLQENFPLKEFEFTQSLTTAPAKVMLMGPDRVAQMCDIQRSRPVYATTTEFLNDVAAIQNTMIGQLVNAGCHYVQLDEPSYTGYVDEATIERMIARGEDPTANLAHAVNASNTAIAGYQGQTCFGIHICRGNRASMWHREGSYDPIAEYLFSELKFDRLLLEYDTERAGGFEPLRFVPRGGPTVVLGLITTKSGVVEGVDSLLRRIEDAQQFIDLEQLAISPQCGFASGIGGNFLSEDAQWRKLAVMQETADKIWG